MLLQPKVNAFILKGKEHEKPQQCNCETFATFVGDKKRITKRENERISVLHAPTNRPYLSFDSL